MDIFDSREEVAHELTHEGCIAVFVQGMDMFDICIYVEEVFKADCLTFVSRLGRIGNSETS